MTMEGYMRLALEEAHRALEKGESPVGALVVEQGRVLSRAHNLRVANSDPTAHAEILALREAGQRRGSWRLDGATLYVTLEPCPMCAGALVLARVKHLVYGAMDPKAGAAGTLYNIVEDSRLNHRLEVTAGVLEKECSDILKAFFESRRNVEGCQSG